MRFSDLDQFRSVAAEYTNSTARGGLVTVAVCCLAALFASLEFVSLVSPVTRTELHVDNGDAESLRIEFNVSFHDLECQYLGIGIRDFFSGGDHKVAKEKVRRTPLDHNGDAGHAYTEEEAFALDTEADVGDRDAAEVAALDTDWKGLGDASEHTKDSFEAMLSLHDFTIVFFHVKSTKASPGVHCKPCRKWRPVWQDFAEKLGASPPTGTRVRALSVNCADLVDVCMQVQVGKVPQIRMYKRGKGVAHFSQYDEPFEVTTSDTLLKFFKEKYTSQSGNEGSVAYHSFFKSGCRVEGAVDVPKVPGTLHFEAVHGPEVNMNFALTNISHTVHHLSFSEVGVRAEARGGVGNALIPAEYRQGLSALNGQEFATATFHRAPHHFLKVVPTHLILRDGVTSITTHQYTVQSTTVRCPKHETPSARFTFDLSPVEVTVYHEHMGAWYDFITAVFAVIGGAFSLLTVASTLLRDAQLREM